MASKFTITAELSLQTKNLNQVVRNLQSQFNNANLNIKIKDLAQAQSHIQKISSSSKQASKDVGVLGNSMEQAFKRFTVITAVTGTLIAFTRAVKRSISEAIDFEREVVKIAQATGETVSQLRGLVNEIDSVSTTFGVASKELILASRSLTQAGFAADKVAGALKVLAQTELAATFDSIQDTTEGAIALLNQFGRQAQKTGSEVKFLEQSFSAINQVSKEFAVESADLVTAIRTTGSAFESAGGNLNELLALFTSVRSTTRESAESIATGFRTIFTRVQRVDTINALRNLGIELQDVEGKFIGPLEAVNRLSTALNTIDPKDFRFNLVVEELGGFRQVSKVIPLIQQFAVTQKALNVAQASSGSLAKDAETAQQALAVQIAKTREEFQKFMREMVGTETFQTTVRMLLDVAGAFIQIADSVKPLIPLIATFGAMKAGSALVPALRSFGGSKRGGIPIGFATGGLVPGSGNGDTVPAMLTPGEFVIRKNSVNKIGATNLAKMNKGGAVTDLKKINKIKDGSGSFKDEIKNIKSIAANAKLINNANNSIGVEKDVFNLPKFTKYAVTIPDEYVKQTENDPGKRISSISGGSGNGGKNFEKYLADRHGLNLANSSDDQFPFDFLGAGDSYFSDAKDMHPSEAKLEHAAAKAINYLMWRNFQYKGYTYAGRNKNLSFSQEDLAKVPLKFGEGQFSTGKDLINFPSAEVAFFYPVPENKNPSEKVPVKSLQPSMKLKTPKNKFFGGAIQRFATGGRVNLAEESKVGAAILETNLGYGGKKRTEAVSIPQMPGKTWTLEKEGLSLETFDTFRESVEAGLVVGLETAARNASSLFAADLGFKNENFKIGKQQANDFLSTVNRGAYGNLFEQVLSLYRSGNFKNDDPGRPFDFTNGLDDVLKDDYKALRGINYIDARASFAAAQKEDFEDKIKNTLFPTGRDDDEREDYTGSRYLEKSKNLALQRVASAEKAVAKERSVTTFAGFMAEMREAIGSTHLALAVPEGATHALPKLNFVNERGSDVTAVVKSILGDEAGSFGKNNFNLTPEQQARVLAQLRVWKTNPPTSLVKKYFGGAISKFASGGFASGTDTVPAMLTPGEFVVNKQSAQRIGYSNLNRMNKVGKYAKGGKVQYLANGGNVGKGGSMFDPDSQRLQASLFLGQYGQIISPQQKKLLEGVINGMINAGLDAEAAMKAMAKDINIRAQNPRALAAYLGSTKDVEEKRSKYLGIGRAGKDERAGETTRATDEYISKLRELSDGSGKAITNILLMAGAAESVIAQFSSLSETYKAGASAFGASLAIYSGITSQLKSMSAGLYASILQSNKEKLERSSNSVAVKANTSAINQNTNQRVSSSVDRLQKSFTVLDGALSGFSVAMALASAKSAMLAKESEISAAKMTETINKFKEDFKSVSENELKQNVSNSFVNTSKSKVVGEGLTSSRSISKIAAGAAIGATALSFVPVLGPLVGGLIGGVAGGMGAFVAIQKNLNNEFEKIKNQISNSGSQLATSMYQTAKSTLDIKKFIEESQNKTGLETSKEAQNRLSQFLSSIEVVNEAENNLLKVFKSFGKIPDVLKNSLDAVSKDLNENSGEISKLVGIALSKQVPSIGSKLGAEGYSPVAGIEEFLNANEKTIRKLAETNSLQKFQRTLSGFKEQGLDVNNLSAETSRLSVLEGNKAVGEAIKQLASSTEQVINQNMAMAKEIKIRENLLGVLSKQLSLESQIANMNYALSGEAMTGRGIEAAYSGGVSGLRSGVVQPSILDIKNPLGKNASDFDKALQIIGDFSPLAKDLKESVREFSKVTPNLDMLIESISLADFEGEPSSRKTATEKLIEQLGINKGSQFASAFRSAIEKTFDVAITGAKEGGFSKANKEREALFRANILDIGKEFNEKFAKPIIEIANAIESASREYRDKILQSQQKEIEIRLAAIDSQKNYFDLIKRASTGRGLTLAENEFVRSSKQQVLVGSAAGNSSKIGAELTVIRDVLQKANLSGDIQQSLQARAKKLETALADLADQSSKTSDIMSKIDEFRAQRETLSESAKDFAFGTSEDKMRVNESFGALRAVLNSGDIAAIPDELKSSVKELLARFKDVPIFNGLTGSQLENELAAREFEKVGDFSIASMLRSQTSSPEQKLIQELRKTAQSEMAARTQMLNQEINYQQENTNAIIALTEEMKVQAAAALTEQEGRQQLIDDARDRFGAIPDEKSLARNLELMQFVVKEITKQISVFETNITKLVKVINEQIATLSEKVQTKAKGGVVHLAGGGSIFKPRGTDTVPAMLTPGEYVIKKSSVDKIGKSTLDAINMGYFSRGGLARRRARRREQMMMEQMAPVPARTRSPLPDRRAARLRRESSGYAAAYAASTTSVNPNFYRDYNEGQFQTPPGWASQTDRFYSMGASKKPKLRVAHTGYSPSTYEDNMSWWNKKTRDFWAYRSGSAPDQRGISEFTRSAAVGLGESAAFIPSLVASGIDLTGINASKRVNSAKGALFGSSARSRAGYAVGFGAGNIFQGGAGAAKLSAAIKRKSAVLDVAQAGAEYLENTTGSKVLGTASGVAWYLPKMRGKLSSVGKGKVPQLTNTSPYKGSAPTAFTGRPMVQPSFPTEGLDALVKNGQRGSHRLVKPNRRPSQWYASGGLVSSMVSPGEYIMNSSAVSKYGPEFMNYLNRGGSVKYFNRGGRAGKAKQTSRSTPRMGVSEYLFNKQQGQQAIWDNKFQQQAQMNPFFSQMGGGQMYGMSPQLAGMEEFGAFVNQFSEAVGAMTMTHNLTVDGQLNIGGIDGNAIAAQISQALGQYVGNIVQQHLNKQSRRPGT